MRWIALPPHFCVALETTRDVAKQHIKTPLGRMSNHKFLTYTQGTLAYQALPVQATLALPKCRYLIEVFMDDYIGLGNATSVEQLNHIQNDIMRNIHDLFLPDADDEEDPISFEKLLKQESSWDLIKEILGFVFHGGKHTQWQARCSDALISTLKHLLCATTTNTHFDIPLQEFCSDIYKVGHSFMAVQAGEGLMLPFYYILGTEPPVIFLCQNAKLWTAIQEGCIFLWESVSTSLVNRWLYIVGITDASKHGIRRGGGIVREMQALPQLSFVWHGAWDTTRYHISADPHGSITNSDLKLAALILIFPCNHEDCRELTRQTCQSL